MSKAQFITCICVMFSELSGMADLKLVMKRSTGCECNPQMKRNLVRHPGQAGVKGRKLVNSCLLNQCSNSKKTKFLLALKDW